MTVTLASDRAAAAVERATPALSERSESKGRPDWRLELAVIVLAAVVVRALFFVGFGRRSRAGARRLARHDRPGLCIRPKVDRPARGGGVQPLALDDLLKAAGTGAVPVEDLLTLEAALTRLEAVDPRAAQVVALRFFGYDQS